MIAKTILKIIVLYFNLTIIYSQNISKVRNENFFINCLTNFDLIE